MVVCDISPRLLDAFPLLFSPRRCWVIQTLPFPLPTYTHMCVVCLLELPALLSLQAEEFLIVLLFPAQICPICPFSLPRYGLYGRVAETSSRPTPTGCGFRKSCLAFSM